MFANPVFKNSGIYIYIYYIYKKLRRSEDGQLLTLKRLKNLIKNVSVKDLLQLFTTFK